MTGETMISRETHPAAWQMIHWDIWFTDSDGRPGQCDLCPFAELNTARNSRAEILNDESEAYYRCSLLGRDDCWGENPKCARSDWVARARAELGLGSADQYALIERNGRLP